MSTINVKTRQITRAGLRRGVSPLHEQPRGKKKMTARKGTGASSANIWPWLPEADKHNASSWSVHDVATNFPRQSSCAICAMLVPAR